MKPFLLCWLLCASLCLCGQTAQAQNTPQKPKFSGNVAVGQSGKNEVEPREIKSQFKPFLWWDEEWKKDNKPFHEIRLSLNKLVDSSKTPDAIVNYRAQFLKNNDHKAMFRWAMRPDGRLR